jgi:hypothetical protein
MTPRRLYHEISRLLDYKKQPLDEATTANLMWLQVCVHSPPIVVHRARANAINDAAGTAERLDTGGLRHRAHRRHLERRELFQ